MKSSKLHEFRVELDQLFPTSPRPKDDQLPGDKDDDRLPEILKDFYGNDWHSIDAETVRIHRDLLDYLSAVGFRYFLPAFMLASFGEDHASAELLGILVLHLTVPKPTEPTRSYVLDSIREFSLPQRVFIRSYLERLLDEELDDEWLRADIEQALSSFWSQPNPEWLWAP